MNKIVKFVVTFFYSIYLLIKIVLYAIYLLIRTIFKCFCITIGGILLIIIALIGVNVKAGAFNWLISKHKDPD